MLKTALANVKCCLLSSHKQELFFPSRAGVRAPCTSLEIQHKSHKSSFQLRMPSSLFFLLELGRHDPRLSGGFSRCISVFFYSFIKPVTHKVAYICIHTDVQGFTCMFSGVTALVCRKSWK